jgi:hypothetical protein
VMHLEVTLQNVKQPKNDRNSGHVRNSDKYGTVTDISGQFSSEKNYTPIVTRPWLHSKDNTSVPDL